MGAVAAPADRHYYSGSRAARTTPAHVGTACPRPHQNRRAGHARIRAVHQHLRARRRDPVRVLSDDVGLLLTYWLVARTETLRGPEVAVLVDAIHARMADQRDV